MELTTPNSKALFVPSMAGNLAGDVFDSKGWNQVYI